MTEKSDVSYRMRDRVTDAPDVPVPPALIKRWADEVASLEQRVGGLEETNRLVVKQANAERRTTEYYKQRTEYILAAIDGHDTRMLSGWVTRLKQSNGEGWAVGEMLERALASQEEE